MISKEAWAETVLFEAANKVGFFLNEMTHEPLYRERMGRDDRKVKLETDELYQLIDVRATSPECKEAR